MTGRGDNEAAVVGSGAGLGAGSVWVWAARAERYAGWGLRFILFHERPPPSIGTSARRKPFN